MLKNGCVLRFLLIKMFKQAFKNIGNVLITDAVAEIAKVFAGFQKYLFAEKVA